MLFSRKKAVMPAPGQALPGRTAAIPTAETHFIFDRPLHEPYPEGTETALFGMGCFWGVERKFWQQGDGIWITAVGYAGGATPNPTYQEICTGMTGHNEVVRVVYQPDRLPFRDLLRLFWESHDPTQGYRQGNDAGTQYRSGIYCTTDAQRQEALASKIAYQKSLTAAGYGPITTEILAAPTFYFAEDYHQQYLAKVPHGYCGLGGTGVACAMPTGIAADAAE